MKITDEMVEDAAKAIYECDVQPGDWVWSKVRDRHRLALGRAALEAALLTDDGAADTPPADTGVRSAQAAESATPVGAGAAAPSSPRCNCDPGPEGQHRYWCDIRGPHNCADHRVTALNGEGESLGYTHCGICGEPLSRASEGATPAIDREQIAERLAEAMADSWMGDEVDCADVATILTPAVVALIEGAQ